MHLARGVLYWNIFQGQLVQGRAILQVPRDAPGQRSIILEYFSRPTGTRQSNTAGTTGCTWPEEYYIGIFFKANWYKAEQYCRYHGMHLARGVLYWNIFQGQLVQGRAILQVPRDAPGQ